MVLLDARVWQAEALDPPLRPCCEWHGSSILFAVGRKLSLGDPMLSALLSALGDGGFTASVLAYFADTWTWGS